MLCTTIMYIVNVAQKSSFLTNYIKNLRLHLTVSIINSIKQIYKPIYKDHTQNHRLLFEINATSGARDPLLFLVTTVAEDASHSVK